jgi:hypothetical protein
LPGKDFVMARKITSIKNWQGFGIKGIHFRTEHLERTLCSCGWTGFEIHKDACPNCGNTEWLSTSKHEFDVRPVIKRIDNRFFFNCTVKKYSLSEVSKTEAIIVEKTITKCTSGDLLYLYNRDIEYALRSPDFDIEPLKTVKTIYERYKENVSLYEVLCILYCFLDNGYNPDIDDFEEIMDLCGAKDISYKIRKIANISKNHIKEHIEGLKDIRTKYPTVYSLMVLNRMTFERVFDNVKKYTKISEDILDFLVGYYNAGYLGITNLNNIIYVLEDYKGIIPTKKFITFIKNMYSTPLSQADILEVFAYFNNNPYSNAKTFFIDSNLEYLSKMKKNSSSKISEICSTLYTDPAETFIKLSQL